MGFWSGLFGGGDIASKVVDGVISGADALVYTDQEKAVAAQKKLDFALEWLRASGASNLARRYIAIMFVAYFLAYLTAVSVAMVWWPSVGSVLAKILGNYLYVPFSGIMGFYYLTSVIRARK